jgi:hypothetical protein
VPPGEFVANVVELAMMGAAEGDGELVADLAAERLGLGEADVVGVGRDGAAENARLRRHVAEMVLVAEATGFAEGEGALVDPATTLGGLDASEAGSIDQRHRLRDIGWSGSLERLQRTNCGFRRRVIPPR